MQELQVPKSHLLQGKEAITALNEYIGELEQYTGEDLTRTQTAALIKLAKGLISSIENETTADEQVKEPSLVAQVRWTLSRLLQHSSEDLSTIRLNGRASDTTITSNPLRPLQHRMK